MPITPFELESSRRNYWATFDPREFAPFPRMTPLTYFDEVQLIRRAQVGDVTARNEVWLRNLRLVLSVVNKFYVPRDMLSDAVQEGALGIRRAIEGYDYQQYVAFSTYAWPWIYQHIQRFLHNRAFPLRVPSHLYARYCKFRRDMQRAIDRREVMRLWKDLYPDIFPRLLRIHRIATPIGLQSVPSTHFASFVVPPTERQSECEHVLAKVTTVLTGRQRHILLRRFGLDGRPEATLQEIGDELGITRERVRQIEEKAIARLQYHFPTSTARGQQQTHKDG